jgi:hypothetical protein
MNSEARGHEPVHRAHRAAFAALVLALGIGLPYIAPTGSSGQTGIPATTRPRAERASGFYDERLQRVVLVGGAAQPDPGERDGVWSWSGTRWEVVTASGPPALANSAGAYDRRNRRAVIAGGAKASAGNPPWQVSGETWIGDERGWMPFGGIQPRDHHAMVTDGRGAVLLYGGIPADRSAPWPADTWELAADSWTRVATEGPPARGRTALAYDSSRGQVVLFGGVSAPSGADQPQVFFGDTWIWENRAWRKVAESGPPGRYAHGMVFDERARVVLLYSGSAAHRNAPLTDMWKWDGHRWSEIALTGSTPGYRYQPVMVYDRARARTILYGGIQGSNDDTWEWDGQRWRQIQP